MDDSQHLIFNSLDHDADIEYSHRNLPHWFQVGAAMFITFRTEDSLPREVLLMRQRKLEDWLQRRNLPIELAGSMFDSKLCHHAQLLESLSVTDRREFRKQTDRMFLQSMDECHGACVLKRPEVASIVAEAILHHAGVKYDLDCFVVMPNHVHAIVQFRSDNGLSIVGQSWMRFTARRINRLNCSQGAFWESEPFDHVIRSAAQFGYLQYYIASNPGMANLRPCESLLWERTRV